MSFKLMLFCMMFTSVVLADSGEKILNDYDPRVDMIAENYEAGPYLIYDCVEKHWTCVLEPYYEECKEKRAQAMHEKKLNLGCAPIGILPNKKSCFQKQLLMVSQNHGHRFCLGNDWKQKEMDF